MTKKRVPGAIQRLRATAGDLARDTRGIAATEFAVIVPLMLVMFFGTVEVSSGVAVDRKVTLMARTLSDLTSQSPTVTDNDLNNFFAASNGIMTPFSGTPTQATITELYIDPSTLQARVQWSKGYAPRTERSIVAIPAALATAGAYLIYSEVNYRYQPVVGYVMAKAGVNLGDATFTKPRQSTCVMYNTTVCTTL